MQRSAWLILLLSMLVKEGITTELEEVEELLKLESKIDLRNAERMVLLIGSTGTGKSTLAKFLTNDPSLQMIPSGRNDFMFKDNDIIGNNIRKSTTLLPNVFQDPETKEIIVDCPGFSDTREPKYEIANAFFIKKVLEYPKKVKIVITENHFSLIDGSDRFGFNRLLIALAELFQNIEQFRGSIAFVGTKAYLRGEPEDVKSDMIEFLANYKLYLEEDTGTKFNKTIQGMLKVLDVLTGQPPGNNHGFFWKPTNSRRWSINYMTNDSRTKIRSLIFDHLRWADNANAVYQFSLSKESRLFIRHTLAPSNIASTQVNLMAFFENFTSAAQSKIVSFRTATEAVDFTKMLQKEIFTVSKMQLRSLQEIFNITQHLSDIIPMNKLRINVVKNLAIKVDFFKVK